MNAVALQVARVTQEAGVEFWAVEASFGMHLIEFEDPQRKRQLEWCQRNLWRYRRRSREECAGQATTGAMESDAGGAP